MNTLYPLFFHPILKERIWGGRSLERLYNKPLPLGRLIGESWEIVDRPEENSVVANGPLAGATLHSLMQKHRALLLADVDAPAGRFPWLIKILDAQQKLSLQVHPPAEKAATLGGEPKTEMWLVAEAQPDADLYVGLKRGVDRAQFEARLHEGRVEQCFHRVQVKRGDAMWLPSGRVHALGAGNVIFEVQQNSDTTYRVFDWNRVDAKGKPRELHIEKSLQSIDFNDFEPGLIQNESRLEEGLTTRPLVGDALFNVDLVELKPGEKMTKTDDQVAVYGMVAGSARIEGPPGDFWSASAGSFCLLPAVSYSVCLTATSECSVLRIRPGTKS